MNFIFHNWPKKLASIALATILWVAVTSSQARAGIFPGQIPISFSNLSNNLVAVTDNTSVQVKIIADPPTWSKLSANSFKATADLNGLGVGTHKVDVQVTSNVANVQIVEKKPAEILVRIEPSITKKIPVTIQTKGDPKEGYSVVSADANPSKVDVTGPESVVSQLSEVTAAVVLGKDIQVQTSTAKIVVNNAKGEPVPDLTFSPSEVTAKIKFGKAATVKSVGVKLKTSGNLPSGYGISEISTSPALVSINGEANLLSTVKYIETKPISLDKITSSTTINTTLDVPSGITLIDSDNNVSVTLTIKQIDITRDITVPVSIINIDPSLKLDKSDLSAIVTIKGSSDNVNQAQASNFKFQIDASGLGAGDYSPDTKTSQVSTTLTNISIDSIKPDKITFKLVKS